MITVSSMQLNTWLAMLLWPAARILALISVAPLFGHGSVPVRVKLGLGLLLTIVIAPTVPEGVAPVSLAGLMILTQQILIGLALGFMMRITFAAVEMAGELCGLTMGLSFASQFDPLGEHQATVTSQLFGWLALMVFVSSHLHLAMLATLADSFHQLPMTVEPVGSGYFRQLVLAAGKVFSIGLQLAMPVIAALLITNLALGVLTRAAPQLNVFSMGMPVTLAVGFLMICLVIPFLASPISALLQSSLKVAAGF